MAKVHSKNTVFKVDNSAGSLVDISGSLDSIEGLPGSYESIDTTSFGDGGHKTILGFSNAKIQLGGSFEAATHTVLSGILGQDATVTFEYGPAGSTSGLVKLTGEGRLSQYSISEQVGGKASFTATVDVEGAVTSTTWA